MLHWTGILIHVTEPLQSVCCPGASLPKAKGCLVVHNQDLPLPLKALLSGYGDWISLLWGFPVPAWALALHTGLLLSLYLIQPSIAGWEWAVWITLVFWGWKMWPGIGPLGREEVTLILGHCSSSSEVTSSPSACQLQSAPDDPLPSQGSSAGGYVGHQIFITKVTF